MFYNVYHIRNKDFSELDPEVFIVPKKIDTNCSENITIVLGYRRHSVRTQIVHLLIQSDFDKLNSLLHRPEPSLIRSELFRKHNELLLFIYLLHNNFFFNTIREIFLLKCFFLLVFLTKHQMNYTFFIFLT